MTTDAVRQLGERARAASRLLALAPTAAKDAALLHAADLLLDRADDVLAAITEFLQRHFAPGAP